MVLLKIFVGKKGSERDPKHVDPDLGWPLDVIPDDEQIVPQGLS